MAEYKIKVKKSCDAESCGFRCQEACPRGVFLAVPAERHKEKQSIYPRHRITPRFSYFCDGCGICIPICPSQRIKVVLKMTGEKILKKPLANK